ncbi:MAG: PDGLE domain-containing protein [Elusimicrobiota bacterium]|jgi:ABC-type uncharacterized transport system YnjBCD permease subunit|nr:PDGLE domain-containing protein [Elusimicrobiota bacterium]
MNKKIFLWILPIAVILLASLFASSYPDALEAISEKYGFAENAYTIKAFFSEYSFPLIDNAFLTAFAAGIAGIILLYLLYKSLFVIVKKMNK